jgi:hypothetical protein
MEIIRPGNPLKINPKYTGVCNNCDCEVLCENKEVTSYTDSRNDSYYFVQCWELAIGIFIPFNSKLNA